ncbi:conserved hypothetical protein [Desulfofarcimen acetoxidans DSM 771]|uniref:Uncharacterized protein n=1 Tax=Desulfofarcimen acetoxidans (strain ATCC 49208 / DSM 771 / KCTC 5769 / VKM B-1644 / 5575) TaxID=485916 RepID=C8VWQ5_DESAS|nr:hypothetical protein [Desulfofarcimen acetoxidans]ACV64419.1 conserved hypothetical protein [Desulfofarcimen acetoxidans DSM 771]
MTIKEYALDTAKNFSNKFVQGITPFAKIPIESMMGKKIFPNIYKPQTIRDRWLNVFQGLSLDDEYKLFAGLPSRPYYESFGDLLYYNTDPKQIAYYATLDMKDNFRRKMLGKGSGSGESIKTDYLYNFKLAVRYKDNEAMKYYLNEYAQENGTVKGLIQSFKMSHPLYGLNKEEQVQFIKYLNKDEVLDLKKALVYYEETYGDTIRKLETMKR